MAIDDINYTERTLQVYFDDDPAQRLYTVPFKAVAPIRSSLRSARFSPGTQVEVKERIDSESPYGWWPACIVRTVYDDVGAHTPHAGPNAYDVRFSTGEQARVPYYNVRSESFCCCK